MVFLKKLKYFIEIYINKNLQLTFFKIFLKYSCLSLVEFQKQIELWSDYPDWNNLWSDFPDHQDLWSDFPDEITSDHTIHIKMTSDEIVPRLWSKL